MHPIEASICLLYENEAKHQVEIQIQPRKRDARNAVEPAAPRGACLISVAFRALGQLKRSEGG